MTCLTFILAWFAVSALVWGGFAFANYRAARKEELESCESCSLCGDPAFCFSGNINALVCEKCFDVTNGGSPIISHSVCLSCRDPIPIDDQPYCHECYARLEREGFF